MSELDDHDTGDDVWSEGEVIEFIRFALARSASFARDVSPSTADRIEGLSAVCAYLDARRDIRFARKLSQQQGSDAMGSPQADGAKDSEANSNV